jgi:sugar lactone lactonase YvrE
MRKVFRHLLFSVLPMVALGCNPLNGNPTSSSAFLQPAPASFEIVSATAANAQVTLDWQSSANATSYNVLRGTSAGNFAVTAATGITGTSYTDTGLANGTTYFYIVTAVGPGGSTNASEEFSAMPSLPSLLVIADTGNNRIVAVSDMGGDGWTSLNGADSDQLNGPRGVFLNTDGSIYVADTLNSRIVSMQDIEGDNWTPFGSAGNGTDQFAAPAAVSLDPSGNIYIADTGNARIVQMTDMTGSNWIALPGSGGNSFLTPTSIAFGLSGIIYVAEVISVTNMQGANWAATNGSGDFESPSSVSVGNDGTVYVADPGTSTVYSMNTEGVVQAILTTDGEGDSFKNPTGICVDGNGVIYVADTGNNRIVSVTDMTGSNWTNLTSGGGETFSSPHSIACRYGSP